MQEKFAKVEALQRELSSVLTNNRQRAGYKGSVQVIPVSRPRLALEVPHPQPTALLWSPRKVTTTPAHTMLVGRSYLEQPKDEAIRFDDAPHALIAGITGAGKSVLLQTMLLSLCAGTSPNDLKLVLVDLKNEDLVPFEKLPHVLTFAGKRETAVDAIRYVVDEKDKRIDKRGYKPFRLVLVIDEMAQLAGDGEARDMLGDLASIGRTKQIHLLGATQHPTEKGGLGTLLKANFPIRLVGMVAPGQSHIATGRPQTHADLLPGKGAFLRCEGPNVYRFQSYFIEPDDVTNMAKYIAREVWGGVVAPLAPVQVEKRSSLVVAPLAPPPAPVHAPPLHHPAPVQNAPLAPLFPLAELRELTAQEAAAVREMAADGMSKNGICTLVYGSKSTRYMGWVNEALNGEGADDGKVIKLRRAS
jgi:hypothetical protein